MNIQLKTLFKNYDLSYKYSMPLQYFNNFAYIFNIGLPKKYLDTNKNYLLRCDIPYDKYQLENHDKLKCMFIEHDNGNIKYIGFILEFDMTREKKFLHIINNIIDFDNYYENLWFNPDDPDIQNEFWFICIEILINIFGKKYNIKKCYQ